MKSISDQMEVIAQRAEVEKQPVTVRWVCAELQVHPNDARDLLQKYWDVHKDAEVTFILSGEQSCDQFGSKKVIQVVNSKELEKVKKEFTVVQSEIFAVRSADLSLPRELDVAKCDVSVGIPHGVIPISFPEGLQERAAADEPRRVSQAVTAEPKVEPVDDAADESRNAFTKVREKHSTTQSEPVEKAEAAKVVVVAKVEAKAVKEKAPKSAKAKSSFFKAQDTNAESKEDSRPKKPERKKSPKSADVEEQPREKEETNTEDNIDEGDSSPVVSSKRLKRSQTKSKRLKLHDSDDEEAEVPKSKSPPNSPSAARRSSRHTTKTNSRQENSCDDLFTTGDTSPECSPAKSSPVRKSPRKKAQAVVATPEKSPKKAKNQASPSPKKPAESNSPRAVTRGQNVMRTFVDDDGFMVTKRVFETTTEQVSQDKEKPGSSTRAKRGTATEETGKAKPAAKKSKTLPASQKSLTSFFKKS